MPKWLIDSVIMLAVVIVGLVVYDKGVRKWLAPKPSGNGGTASSASSGMGGSW